MNYISLPMNPFRPPTKEQVDKYFSIVDNPEYQPVYVHCSHGQDRTGVMVGIYRVKDCDWSFKDAYKEMKSFGYHPRLYWRQKTLFKEICEQRKRYIHRT